jgi:hypothetical protein
MLYGEGAQQYFVEYIEEKRSDMRNSKINVNKVKGKKQEDINDMMIDHVIRDCEFIAKALSRTKNKQSNKKENKALYLYQGWRSLSAYYLCTIPWIDEVLTEELKNFNDDYVAIDMKKRILLVRKDKKLFKTCKNITKKTEKHFSIPENIEF